ncbi:MAG: hypothetical protein ACI865_000498 [Flavobacteriaceae bacterium]|jgi:hypothetical protein
MAKKYSIMKLLITNPVFCALFFFIPALSFSQTLQLGVLSSFEAYTGSGAITNSGTFTGDVGTDNGIISGFGGAAFTGTVYNSDVVTAQAKIDILRVYIHLNDIFVTHANTHAASFGGETLPPGIYSIPGAGSIGGALTLDGGGNTDAVFIVKFLGALTVGAASTITLTGGAQASNVYWIAEGAISVAAGSVLKGTLFSHAGAVSLGVNCDIEGRLLTTQGAITVGAGCVAIQPQTPSTVQISCLSECNPAPEVNILGTVEIFSLFSSAGAVTNTGSSGVIGSIGTNGGSISGFGSSTVVGSVHTPDATTAQAAIDLDNAYTQLMLLPNTITGHAAAFGIGETITAGVYYIGAAGSLSGTITLDGQSNPDAVFVFKFAGAFSVAAQSKVILTNGTRRCNVFWLSGAGVSTGATSMGAFSFIKGTVIAHNGACNMGVGGFIEGRMLSTAGAVGFSTGVIYNDPLCFSDPALPIELFTLTASVKETHIELNWITASELNNDYFTVERSRDAVNFTSLSKIEGAGNSTETLSYSTIDTDPLPSVSYYRLKQTDYDGKTSYSNIEAVAFNENNLKIYPNPFSVATTFRLNENIKDARLIVYNSYGRVVKQLENISGLTFTFAREDLLSGMYIVRVIQDKKIVTTAKIVITD